MMSSIFLPGCSLSWTPYIDRCFSSESAQCIRPDCRRRQTLRSRHTPKIPPGNSMPAISIRFSLAATYRINKPVTSPPHSAAPGVKIVFSDGTGPKQTLYYFLADGSFERSGFSAFLAKLDPADSFIFAGVRKPLLDSSATILQDDSGIPLGYFEARRWRFQAFGHYAGPITMFANFHQPQMAELFKGARPIEFGIGYRWRKERVEPPPCTKESSPSGDAELTPPSQAEGNAAGTGAPSPKKTRKRMETEATRSPGCRIARVLLVEAK